jgi:hypothetical protein
MNHLSALVLTTLISLGALSGAQADSAPAAPTLNGSVMAIGKPPPPTVTEAPNDELDLQTLGTADATVVLTYPEIANGHTAGLYWTSPVQQYRAPVQTVSNGAKSVTFKIPNATVIKDLGQSPVLTASVGVGNDPLVISQPRTLKIINGAPPGQYEPPTLPDVQDNQVDIGALTGDLKVVVAYPTMGAGQIVRVLWRGATSYDTPLRLPPDNTPLEFTIPQATVAASLGKLVAVSYEVALDGQAPQTSDPLGVNVLLKTIKQVPVAPGAVGGQVDLKDLAGKPLRITYTYTGITPGHTAGIRWTGNPVYDTPHPEIGATPRPLEFTIPYDKVRLEKDKTVLITASVGVGDGHLAISPELSLKIIDTRPKGEEIADELNTRYNATPASCANGQPSNYCSGVTIRGTDNGNFDPWDPSPTQQRKGSVSFTYLRKDAKITTLFKTSGYIWLSEEQAIQQGKKQEYLCFYVQDAHTDIVGRPGYGCGLQTRANEPLIDMLASNPKLVEMLRNDDALLERLNNGQGPGTMLNSDPETAALLNANPTLGALLSENARMTEEWNRAQTFADASTCAGRNATTPASWYTYSSRLTHPAYQCSLNAQNAAQFDTSVKARQYTVPWATYGWNELLVKVWSAGIPAKLPLQAFFYKDATGLPAAKVYQQKFAAKTGGQWLPVIKLDMTKLAGNPFSYSAADQAIQP